MDDDDRFSKRRATTPVTKWLLLAGGRRNVEFGLRIEYNRLLKNHLRSVEETCGKGGETSVVVRMMAVLG
jgi:hypothetical protein